MKVRMLSTSVQPCRWDIEGGTAPTPLDFDSARICQPETAVIRDDENGVFRQAWKLGEGALVELPEHAAKALIGLKYAELY